jgi:Fe-S oxidoreductase
MVKRVTRAIVRALQKGDVSFGSLGTQESCCGESVRRAGAEEAFQRVASANVKAMDEVGARKVLAISPHCNTTFQREYGEVGGELESRHYTQLLAELIEEGRLTPEREIRKKVVYHDPCTLGRQCGVFEEPREVLRSIPGLELGEIPYFNRANSYCCGGGSGGVWLDRPKGERMSDIRVQQAVATGADILAVACPYCHQMFEDSVKTTGAKIEIRDVGELIAEAVGITDNGAQPG